jgi:hypothetical protein
MEDGDSQLLMSSGRDGAWFVIRDETSGAWTTPAAGAAFTMAENPQPRGMSERAAALSGGGFADWGAALAFNFRASTPDSAPPYDASAYSGISFYGRSLEGVLDVRVTIPDASSHPSGGICSGDTCYNHFHSNVSLSGVFKKYTIPFSSLTKDGDGAFNQSIVFGVEFVVTGNNNFQFVIDDIAFTRP